MTADFTDSFWSTYVTVITVLSLIFCLVVLVANSKRPPPTADNTTGHVWDEDIREANNPLPRWWMGLFVITVVFAAIYLALYPGLGSYQGTLGWSSECGLRWPIRRSARQESGSHGDRRAAVPQ